MLINLKRNNDIIDPDEEFYYADKGIIVGTIYDKSENPKDIHNYDYVEYNNKTYQVIFDHIQGSYLQDLYSPNRIFLRDLEMGYHSFPIKLLNKEEVEDKLRENIKNILIDNGYYLDEDYYVDERTSDPDFNFPSWIHKKTKQWIASNVLLLDLKFLLKYQIDKHITHGMGFSTKQQKWYGWSHRAIAGYGIGDKITKSNIAYRSDSINDLYEELLESFPLKNYKLEKTNNNSIKVYELMEDGSFEFVKEYYTGRGEFVIKTLDEAKECAKNFKEEVA